MTDGGKKRLFIGIGVLASLIALIFFTFHIVTAMGKHHLQNVNGR